jgi:HSP20 family protein
MNDEMQDMFRQMDAMMERLFAGMEAGFPRDIRPGISGYHIVISGGPCGEDCGCTESHPRDTREPVTEVHRIGSEVKVIAELPGATEETVRLALQGDSLTIDAGDADRHYHTHATLPPVDPATLMKSIKNGVLEVTFTALQPEHAAAGS